MISLSAIPPWARLAARIGLATIGLLLLVDAVRGVSPTLAGRHWDLEVDRLSARAYLDGYSPFTPEGAARSTLDTFGPAGNGHPPTTSFWFLPVGRVDEYAVRVVMTVVVVLLIAFQLIQLTRVTQVPAPMLWAWVAIGYLLGCTFMRYHLQVGQISAIVGFFFFLAWSASRSGRDFEAGMALGAACTLKLFPGVVVILFLLHRRWRVVCGAGAVYLAIAVVMTAGFGLSSWPAFLSQQKRIADIWMGSLQNQSIHGIVAHWFAPVCGPSGPVLPKATYISSAIAAAMLAFSGWLVWRSRKLPRAFDLQFWMFVVLSVVSSQWTWEHYSIIYVPAVFFLGRHLIDRWRTEQGRVGTAAMAVALIGVVASWRIDYMTKQSLQSRYMHGDASAHIPLHIYEALNWLPGFVLLALMLAALGAAIRSNRALPASLPPR